MGNALQIEGCEGGLAKPGTHFQNPVNQQVLLESDSRA